ncbi:MAG: hypothetical protein RJB66_2449 [Pseudomonadota bacterium]|jgi:hypothetical protein
MKKESGINLQNPKKRELSPFLAQQMLYDYSVKNVDPLRERAVANALQGNPELGKSLDDILYGLSYCHHLSKTTLTPELLDQLKRPLHWKSRLLQLINLRTWNKNALWMLEAVFIGSLMLVASLTLPWESYITKFMKSQHPELIISEVSREETKQKPVPTTPPVEINDTSFEYEQKAQLFSPNPGFTSNRLATALPRLGASIEHQSMRETDDKQVVPFLRLSIPSSQTEALLSELGTHGQLTWLSAPAENKEEGAIFGMELWILKEKPPEPVVPRPPSKDKKRK